MQDWSRRRSSDFTKLDEAAMMQARLRDWDPTMMHMPTFWRTTGRLVMAAIVIAVQPPAAANPARARASDAQMAAMDSYFGCAFAVMRESRAKGLDTPGYEAALESRCSAEEQLLHRRSAALAEAQGMTPTAARAKADQAISAAHRDLVRTYSGQ